MITSFLVFRTKIFRLFTFICVYAFFQDFLKTRFGVTQGKRVLRSRVVAVIKEQYDVNVSAPIVGRAVLAAFGGSKTRRHGLQQKTRASRYDSFNFNGPIDPYDCAELGA